MNTKLPAILLLTIIALFTIGYSQACKNWETSKKFNLAFINVTTSDNEAEIDVATIQAQITQDKNSINAYITNAYPSYEAYITYTIQNIGKIPARLDSLTIKNPNPEAIQITITHQTHKWLKPGQTMQGTTTIRILETAEENSCYTFQIIMGFSCQKEKPRTIGYWKQQFTAALTQTETQQKIAPETLEDYLEQITIQSAVFEFTGTRQQKFQKALSILEMPKRPTMEDKLKAQLLALWLNYVAGWTEGYTIDGKTAYEIIQDSENALLNKQTWRYEYWKDFCEKFNNLSGE